MAHAPLFPLLPDSVPLLPSCCLMQSFIRRVLALRRVRVLRGEREAVVLAKKGKAATIIQCLVRQRLAVKAVRPSINWWICRHATISKIKGRRYCIGSQRKNKNRILRCVLLCVRWSVCCWAVTRRRRPW